MRALISREAGGPRTLVVDELPEPTCGPDMVVIDVHACGVNYPDLLVIADKYQFRPPRPFAPGGEVAGVVRSVGERVVGLASGDRVIGLVGWNGMAEQVVCAAGKCLLMPASMSFADGAAFLGTYGTSYHALKQRAHMQAGESLLVLGAAGGVGIAAVELGRAMGADVVAAVSSEAKLDFARERGAQRGLVYPAESSDAKTLSALFRDAAPEAGFDIVYDAVGGVYAEAAFRSLAWGGRQLVVGFPAGIPSLPLNLALLKGAAAIGVFYGAFTDREPEASQQDIAELFEFYAAGHIRPAISSIVPLEEAAAALELLEARSIMGKIVVMVR